MHNKYWILLLASTVLTLPIFPVLGETETTTPITFSCEEDRGIPITIAKNQAGKNQTIFNWKPEAFPHLSNTLEICHTVSQKLNLYAAGSNNFQLFAIQPTEQAGLPAICATKTGFNCDLVLLTLAPAEEPVAIACDTLMTIIDREVNEPIQDTTRNIQSDILIPISLFFNKNE